MMKTLALSLITSLIALNSWAANKTYYTNAVDCRNASEASDDSAVILRLSVDFQALKFIQKCEDGDISEKKCLQIVKATKKINGLMHVHPEGWDLNDDAVTIAVDLGIDKSKTLNVKGSADYGDEKATFTVSLKTDDDSEYGEEMFGTLKIKSEVKGSAATEQEIALSCTNNIALILGGD